MKKISLLAAMAIIATAFIGCGRSTPKANLKDDVDSMSYGLGMAQTRGLKSFLVVRLGVDTTYMADFIKGVNDGVYASDDAKKSAYYAGIQIGQQISNQMMPGINYEVYGDDSTQTISLDNFVAGFVDGATGKNNIMKTDQAQLIARMKMQSVKSRHAEERYGGNREIGRKFCEEYAKNDSVKHLANGVMYKVLKEGKGALPTDSSYVEVRYVGKLIDGTVFEDNLKRNKPIRLRMNQVIKGWSEALTHMPVGSRWEIVIPEDQAYGERQREKIEPFSTLIFDMELVGIPENTPKKHTAKKKK